MKKFFGAAIYLLIIASMWLSACGGGGEPSTNSSSTPSSIDISSLVPSELESSEIQQSYTIYFDLDGGTSSSYLPSITVDGFSSQYFFYDCVKEGNFFRGWSYNGEKVLDENGLIISIPEMTNNMTFKAIYSQTAVLTIEVADEYKDAVSSISETKEYPFNTYVDIYAHPKQGYKFLGWYYDNLLLCSEEDYHYMMWSEDVTLEARFARDAFSLNVYSYNPDLGLVLIRDKTQINQEYQPSYQVNAEYLSDITIAAYTKTSTRFLGWYDANNNLVTTNAVYSFKMTNYPYNLYAKWDKFNITYNLGGGINNPLNPRTYASSDIVTLYQPTKTGYTFLYWLRNGEQVDSINGSDLVDITLTAVWSLDTYSISYHLDGGINSGSNPSTYTYEDETITLANPTKEGYTFLGWFDDEEYNNQITTIPSHSTGDIELYAVWELDISNLKYTINGTTASITGLYDTSVSSVIIPSSIEDNVEVYSVTSIGSEAFYNCSNLSSITIPDSVISIGNYAFQDCSNLTSITIPDSVTSIGSGAFSGCSKLTSVTIGNSVTSIGERAFSNCSNLSSITIPDSATSIGHGAFFYCSSLTFITIPESVTSIGNYVFQGCSKLAKVYYKGNKPYTSTITDVGSNNDKLLNAKWYYFTNNGISETTQGNWWYYHTDGVTIIEKVVE